MSTKPHLLTDSPSSRDTTSVPTPQYDELRRKYERLQDELAEAKLKIQEARNQSAKALRAQARLRNQLEPLYKAIRGVMEELPEETFGEAIPTASASSGTLQPHSPAAWQAWKQQLPPSCGKIIDALIVQPLTATQLKSMCKVSYETVRQSLLTLGRNGLIEKEGDLNRLKRI